MRNRLWVVLGVGLGLMATFLVHAHIRGIEDRIRKEFGVGREPVPVLVATRDVQGGAQIEPGMMETMRRPSDSIQPHALTEPNEAIGKVAVVPIYAGEQVLGSKLRRLQSVRTLSMKLPQGKRAVTIAVDAITGVGGFIHPGDFVDVLGSFAIPTPGGQQSGVTVTLLQHVTVLAAGAQFVEGGGGGGAGRAGETTTVTLALSPQEAELVLFARGQGQIQLALRPKADSQVLADLPPMTVDTLLAIILGPEFMRAQQQPAPEVKERQVEVYRALEKEVVVVSEPSP